MSMLDGYISKFAASKEDIDEEKRLILAAQSGDVKALKRLKTKYKGAFNAISNSYANSYPDVDRKAISSALHDEFVRSVNSYDATHASAANPYTLIYGNMKKAMKTKNITKGSVMRTSENDYWKSHHVRTAKENLINEGIDDPTPEQVNDYFARPGNEKDWANVNNISRIMNKDVNELSGNINIGEEGVGENINLQTAISGDTTPEDYIEDFDAEDHLNKILGQLDPTERAIYRDANGLDSNGVIPKKMDLAAKHGFKTPHFFDKKVEEIDKKVKDIYGSYNK